MTGGMMFKGTPGPWSFDKDDGEVYSPNGYKSISIVLGHGCDVSCANGNVIAAAPELLEALKLAKDHSELPDEVLNIVDDAIAKALGETK